jgi:NADH-quinone oxidoreductase subunit H
MSVVPWAFFRLLIFPGFVFLVCCGLAFQWIDRRVSARLQGRYGPPWFQPLADLIKLLAKEDTLPLGADELVCTLLPIASLAAVLSAAAYVPLAGQKVQSFEGDLIVVVFLLSLPTLAFFLAGWFSVSIYSVIGGNRSLLQYLAYEVPFLMALGGAAILNGSWSIAQIAVRQSQTAWGLLLQPVGFSVAIIALIGKLKRPPFDIPKAKTEISAGPLTEFSGRKLALWYLTRDIEAVVGAFLLVNLFLGGGRAAFWSVVAFGAKALFLLLALSVASVLYARLRIDQLVNVGWRVLAPAALLQLLVTVWMGVG